MKIGRPGALCGAVLLLVTLACTPPHVHTVHGCSVYATGQCLTPYPSAWFEQPGASTVSGYSIVFPDGVLPSETDGTPVATTLMGKVDGWSPATPIIVYFKQLVATTDLTPSLESPIDDRIQFLSAAGSPIALVDVSSRVRVPIFAELDATANPAAGDRQALIIHPAVRLQALHRYAVAITTSLHDGSGQPMAPEGQFASWVNGTLTSKDSLWEVSDRLDEDAAAFVALGIAKKDLALAWDFDTASDASTTGQLTGMIAQALASGPGGFGYAIQTTTSNTPAKDPNAARVITGTFQAPSFETGPDPSPLNLDPHGVPIMGAVADWSFTALISQCAAASTGPVPLVVMGHGIFSNGNQEVTGSAGLLNTLCAVGIGADWLGLASADIGVLTQVLADPNHFNLITGRLEQAHLNFQVLTRVAVRKLGNDAAFMSNGHAILGTSSPVYYWGESLGGIEGTTFLALSAESQRGVLVVPGAEWSLLMWRSGDFAVMLEALQGVISDKVNLEVILSMSQSLWDKTDPIDFSPLMVGTTKSAVFQESIGDPVVTNVSTRIEMRTINAKPLEQLIQPVFGLTATAGPLTGLVYAQFSIDPMPMPPYTPVPGPSENGAHQGLHSMAAAVDQGVGFLQTGQVVNTCDGGMCVFPGG